ncbi:MAG: DNA primase [Candidatus Eisenbacteria sp.]|nr:DNA primase [Candidatus Eisenbacteria bacterium]
MERGIGQDAVEQVRQATDIVELIGAYVDLRPAGRGFKACCPFHKEKTPSFHISPERQLFHCFGCGVGGDAFSFVMQHDGLTFPEALEMLANRAGVTIPERSAQNGMDRAQILAALRGAVRYYRGKLRGAEGRKARQYLDERGVPQHLRDSYYIGFAPAGAHALLDYARVHVPTELLVQAGLVGRSEGGRLYDRFRERVVIPILSVAGEPIGFGARALRGDVEPKYLNSPETSVYKKAQILFGLPQARTGIREQGQVLVVEGYFDVLSLASNGINYAVAPCGTACTQAHGRLVLRYTQRLVFLFDGDAAGEKAAWRALEVTLPIHPDIGIVVLPEGKDPDDMVRGGHLEQLRRLLATPLTPVAFAAESLARAGTDGHPLIRGIAELLAKVGNALAREMMVEEAAERTRIPVRILRQEVERRGRLAPRRTDVGLQTQAAAVVRLTRFEEALLQVVQADPSSAKALREALQDVPVVRQGIRDVVDWVAARFAKASPPEPAELLQRMRMEFGEEIHIGFLLAEGAAVPNEQLRDDLLRRLRQQALEAENEALGHQIQRLEAQGDQQGAMNEQLKRKQEIAHELALLSQQATATAVQKELDAPGEAR